MYCSNCGSKLDEGAKFCVSCGTKKGASIAPSEENPSPQPYQPIQPPYIQPPPYVQPQLQYARRTPGKNYLLVTGIITIVGAGLALVILLSGYTFDYDSAGIVVLLISSIFELFAGIMAVINCNKLEKAKLLENISYVYGGLTFASSFKFYSSPSEIIVGLLLMAPLVIFFYIGAIKNVKAYNASISPR